jgi:hypothetical protein
LRHLYVVVGISSVGLITFMKLKPLVGVW